MKMAGEPCREAFVIRGNAGECSKHSYLVTEIFKEHVPVLEKSSIDEFYADLTGIYRFFGSYKHATQLRSKIIRETGLPISFALSINIVVYKVPTNEAKPNVQLKIDDGFEKSFLAPLSIKKVPLVDVCDFPRLWHVKRNW